ncbi:MAG: M50 family metallopeptidase [Clostridiales bacterium]|jgi:Zn-dependent protease|nr:M50 family metallopeptidase [Clostridiales bacterium]
MIAAIFLISYSVFFFLGIIIHECGHLVTGLLSGYKFLSFRILSFVWHKADGKLSFTVSKNRFILGQCLMEPPKDEKDFKFILYNLGGGLMNLAVAAVSALFMAAFSDNRAIFAIALSSLMINALIGLTNLIPLVGILPNDGYNVATALKSKAAKHGFFVMLRLNFEMAGGKRLRDYSASCFSGGNAGELSNFFVAYLLMCEAGRLYDLGFHAESAALLEKLIPAKLPLYYRNSCLSEILYYYLTDNPDLEKAKSLHGEKGMIKFLNIGIPSSIRIKTAYEFFVNKNLETSKSLFKTAQKAAETFENKGISLMESNYLAELADLMAKSLPDGEEKSWCEVRVAEGK